MYSVFHLKYRSGEGHSVKPEVQTILKKMLFVIMIQVSTYKNIALLIMKLFSRSGTLFAPNSQIYRISLYHVHINTIFLLRICLIHEFNQSRLKCTVFE